ncbi:hypothetical protein CHS0354_008982 [Potamilus streckersoni]|uniref:Protein piccolo n=1 Tax=Potamilus streckersoni TaxID=2493646 RepID=A0AAE0WEE7_9BIVA|nr:hypothetical protein CHS0354_008982 [Potamilus streckersoni]
MGVMKRSAEVSTAAVAVPDRKDTPLCPLCNQTELKVEGGRIIQGQNICIDCQNLTCENCGSLETSFHSKIKEWVCKMCQTRRKLVLSSGMWYPGCDVGEDVPLSREFETSLEKFKVESVSRAPLERSASTEVAVEQSKEDSNPIKMPRQASLPDHVKQSSLDVAKLEIITETSKSSGTSQEPSPTESAASDDVRSLTGTSRLKGMGTASSRSDSDYSDITSDVDMEDVSMLRSHDGFSPDDVSDDYSLMSIGSSDDSGKMKRKHRPKSLSLSRSHSATSSDDETGTDSAVSTDVESKYLAAGNAQVLNDIRIALAASAFVEDMRVDMSRDTDEDITDASLLDSREDSRQDRFSPSIPISPSWREGLESPPFSPRRRDSYPGKRRGSPSPKEKRLQFTYDISPPARQLSFEEIYGSAQHSKEDKEGVTAGTVAVFAQRPLPKSPEEINDDFFCVSGETLVFDKPSSLKKSKPFYDLGNAQEYPDVSDSETVMDLATYAATIASNTANLTSLSVSPPNLLPYVEEGPESQTSTASSSPVSPGFYDNIKDEDHSVEEMEDMELADPSQKPIDYQGTKRQKARPPTTDWSPVIDLSPIMDVSPSVEEAEQQEMLLSQQEERKRQESREYMHEEDEEEHEDEDEIHQEREEVEYKYYGLKRYDRVENISSFFDDGNGSVHGDYLWSHSETDSSKTTTETESDANGDKDEVHETAPTCTSSSATPVTESVTTIQTFLPKENKIADNVANPSSSLAMPVEDESRSNVSENIKMSSSKDSSAACKTRRKLPQPTPEILATHKTKPNIPKPIETDKLKTTAGQTQVKETKPEIAAVLTSGQEKYDSNRNVAQNQNAEAQLVRQDTDERKRKAKDMKAKPDPELIKHIETEEASMSPQYRVLDSPPSPETKTITRREYSDSTSVSPSSSPDIDVYQYPSPVTPPDSDSSPPKPHSPSSGTDFEEEAPFIEQHRPVPAERKSSYCQDKGPEAKSVREKVKMFEKEIQPPPIPPKPKPSSQVKETKLKEQKKVRRRLPSIPNEEEQITSHKSKVRSHSARRSASRSESKQVRRQPATSSQSDDSSMNEEDLEVANIIRHKYINDLDKPSLDKRNGNYLTVPGDTGGGSSINGYRSDEFLKVNIPPDVATFSAEGGVEQYRDETDRIIDSLINIYDEPITKAMRSLKKRLQVELRRVTEGRRRKIEEFEEIRALKIQIGELKLSDDTQKRLYDPRTGKPVSLPATNGKKKGVSPYPTQRSSPQVLPRRARHKRQSSDPMVAKFSPIKEDKDIESEIQNKTVEEYKHAKSATDDSSQSGLSDSDSIRSEPLFNARYHKTKPSDYAKMFFSKQASSAERFDVQRLMSGQLPMSHSEGHLPDKIIKRVTSPTLSDEEERRLREEKKQQLQYEIQRRKQQLAGKSAQTELRKSVGSKQYLAHSCDELLRRTSTTSGFPSSRPIPTGIIKPIDDDDSYADHKSVYRDQSYSSTEYLAHKQEEAMRQRYEELGAYSTPFLYSGDIGEKSAFVPQTRRTNLEVYSYSTGNVNINKDVGLSGSVTLPEIRTIRSDMDITKVREAQSGLSDTENNNSPNDLTPAMPLLDDVTAKSRKIIHEIGSGSRPVSAEFNLGVEELMNGMYHVESDNSVDADEPIMKHILEGGVTILKQLERKKQPPPPKPKKYFFPTKRILLTSEPKDRSIKGRQGNGIGMKIVGGKQIPGTKEVGAFVTAIYKGGVAEQLLGELREGDQILEWNGIELNGKSFEEVQQIISQQHGEIELVVRTIGGANRTADTSGQERSCHSSYDNLEVHSDEETDHHTKQHQGVDPKQLAAQLEGIKEDDSLSTSLSSSHHTPSGSSCSTPHSDSAIPPPSEKPQQTTQQRTLDEKPLQRPLPEKPTQRPLPLEKPEQRSPLSERPVPRPRVDKIPPKQATAAQMQKYSTEKQVPKTTPEKHFISKHERQSSKGERNMGDVQIKLSHNAIENTLTLHIIRARNLLQKDINGLSDPFVKIYLLPGRCSENKRRTKYISRTLNPEWHETVVFHNIHPEELKYKTLELTVWDYDRFKANDFLGEVVLDLADETYLDDKPYWFPLCDHDDSRGMELPRPTVLPPSGDGPFNGQNTRSPRAKSRDRLDKNIQSGPPRGHGLGRRRRSLGTLTDVDKV